MIEPGAMQITIRTADWVISVHEPNLLEPRSDPGGIGLLVARAVAMTLPPRLSHLTAAFVEFCLDQEPIDIDSEITAAERDLFVAAQRLLELWQDHDDRLDAFVPEEAPPGDGPEAGASLRRDPTPDRDRAGPS